MFAFNYRMSIFIEKFKFISMKINLAEIILTYKNILPLPCENLLFSSLDFFIRAFF